MRKLNKTTIITAASTLAIGFLVGLLVFGGKDSGTTPETHHHDESKIEEWTCSMHPSVRQKEPGQCPICGMDLIPVETGYGDEHPMEIKMSQTAIQLASVQTSSVEKGGEFPSIRLNGKVQPNEQNVYTQTSHITGRIEALQLSFTGEYVRKGQEIAKVYSPELVLAQKELFEAYKIRDTQPELYQAAREKLKNWKLTDKLIDQIIENGKPQEQFPIFSDINGVVLSKKVNLGDYVNRGSALFEIADLSRLWILLDVYESDLGKVKADDEVEYTMQSLPGETFQGKIGFIDPVINPKTRVARARISVNNSNQRLKPEMFVTAYVKGKSSTISSDIIIPKSAIMWTGKRSIVYVKHQTDVGISFEMREVTLGPAMGDSYIIEDGLSEGEEIATYGTFSIDAAAQLAGKPSMMNPQMEMIEHDNNHEEADSVNQLVIEVKSIQLNAEMKNTFNPIIENYLELKDALVNDDFELAKNNASKLLDEMKKIKMEMFEGGDAHQVWMQHGMEARQNLEEIGKAENIGEARALFKPFSQHMIQLVKNFNPFEKKLYIQHCPMADDFKGADWLSTEENIMNPYFGESMLTCGEVTEEISNQ